MNVNLSHIVSLVGIAVSQAIYNSLFWGSVAPSNVVSVAFNASVNVAAFAGLSYYAVKVAINASGLTETTTPPKPA